MTGPQSDDDQTKSFHVLTQGAKVSHYRIVEKIGAGGMGEVYLAEDTKLDRCVALKFLPSHLAADNDIRARFTREAKAVAKLNHPNIVTIHEVGEFEGRPFFAMEYVEGNTLSFYHQDTKLSISETITFAIQICDGLSKAHQMGIVHRDIKPANVVIDSDNRPKILDFGLAAVQGADTLTKTGSTLGTIAYMSPEQAQGKALDQRSDIFSFGTVLYELITGQSVFKRDSDPATLHAIVSDDPEPLARYRSNIPDELQRIVTKLLERDSSLRYQNTSDIIADLKKLAITGSSPTVTPVSASRSHGWKYATIVAAVIVPILLIYLILDLGSKPEQTQLTITRLTNDGKVDDAAISPDGSYISYVRFDGVMRSLWIKHISTNSKVQVVKPDSMYTVHPSFSSDGSFVYYVKVNHRGLPDLFRVPLLGGESKMILPFVFSKVSFSPDGSQMAFLRYSLESDSASVVIASSDGSNERVLATGGIEEYYFGSPAWSPKGDFIAISKGKTVPRVRSDLVLLNVMSGKESWSVSGDWVNPLSIRWLPDGTGLVFAAHSRSGSFGSQLWHAEYPSGKLKRITNDLNAYSSVSITSDGLKVSADLTEVRSGVWLVSLDHPNKVQQVLSGRYDGFFGLCWIDSTSIAFSSLSANNWNLSRYYLNRNETSVIVSGNPLVMEPDVSTDGGSMIYVDWAEDYSGISMIELNGRNKKQITTDGEYHDPKISPNQDWIALTATAESGMPQIIRISLDLRDTVNITTNKHPYTVEPTISPDGKRIACKRWDDESFHEFKVAIIPSTGGDPTQVLDMPQSTGEYLHWSSDGSSILFTCREDGFENIWSQPLDGSPKVQLSFFNNSSLGISYWDLSSDGKKLAVCRYASNSDAILIENFQ